MAWWRSKTQDSNSPTAEQSGAAPSPSGDVLQEWIDGMDVRLDRLRFLLQDELPLDFSRSSLQGLERYALTRLARVKDVYEPGNRDVVELLVRYVGETYVRLAGGRWDFQAESGRASRFIVHLDVPIPLPIDPHQQLTIALSRQSGECWTQLYDALDERVSEQTASTRQGPSKAAEPGREDAAGAVDSPLAGWLERTSAGQQAWLQSNEASGPWDGSDESLDRLEELVLSRYDSWESVESLPNDAFRDGAARYFGDLMLGRSGGQWVFSSSERKPGNLFAGRPFVTRTDARGVLRAVVPGYWMSRVVKEQKKGYFRRELARYIGDGS